MNDIIFRIWFRLKEMPLFLRFLTLISPAGILMILVCLIPVGSYGVNGRLVSYGEFWRSGWAFFGIAIGFLLAAIGVGIFKRMKWAKQLIFATVVLQDILTCATIGEVQNDEIVGSLISLAFVNVLAVWYLFIKKSVKMYFESESDVQQTGGAVKPHTL